MYNRKSKTWKYIEFALLDTFKIQLNACYAMVLMLPSPVTTTDIFSKCEQILRQTRSLGSYKNCAPIGVEEVRLILHKDHVHCQKPPLCALQRPCLSKPCFVILGNIC